MNVDLLWIVGALIIPLVGVAFSMLVNRIAKSEKDTGDAVSKVHEDIADLRRYVRHEMRTTNQNLIKSLTADRHFSITKLVEAVEAVSKILDTKAHDELAVRRNTKLKQGTGDE